jgi:hypothetical protein
MEIGFSYIRNRISEHKKDDLLEYCFSVLESKKNEHFPIWYIFILMKWTYVYGDNKYPPKVLNPQRFNRIYNAISNFNQGHISSFIKEKKIDKAFQILYNQQFYLQKTVYKEIYATQLKLFSTLNSKYDIEESFKTKTGFSILDFLFIEQIVWLYINIKELKQTGLYFDGYLDEKFLNIVAELTSVHKVKCFLTLLTLNPLNASESITSFRHKINKEDLQTMEMSFFTMYPFQIHKGKIKLVHEAIYKHTVNYYIYDFLKSNDPKFTTEFGYRLEKYIALGLDELDLSYKTENQLKKLLPEKSNLVDFFIQAENIFIESKATELQAYPYVNPTDELLYNSLKSSIFKAYFEQLSPVSKQLSPEKENWGIIITYKEMFWSKFSNLFQIGKSKYENANDTAHLPPENVYIIDIYTWDKMIQIVKDKKATLSEILAVAKENNSKSETSKQLFNMHLDIYDLKVMNLHYLQNELKSMDIKESTTYNISNNGGRALEQ